MKQNPKPRKGILAKLRATACGSVQKENFSIRRVRELVRLEGLDVHRVRIGNVSWATGSCNGGFIWPRSKSLSSIASIHSLTL